MAEKNKITIDDVARKAGVSRQTVSRVLNNRQDVSSDTRKRIQDIMEGLNYHPNAIARSLSRQKSYIFGVVTAGLKYIGPSRTLSGITSKAEELGYGLLLKELASFSANNVHPLIQWFQSHQVDGIIWAAPEIEDNRKWMQDLLPEIDIPIIFLTMEKRETISIVSIDNFLGARMATEHLISLGRKRIGHISGPLTWWEARQRKMGWEAADIVRQQLITEPMAIYRSKPFVAGAIFWTYQDYRTRSNFIMSLVDSQRNQRGSWEVLRDEYSPAFIDTLTLPTSSDGQRVATVSLHTRGPMDIDMPIYTLREYTLHWEVTLIDKKTMIFQGDVSLPNLAPTTQWTGEIKFPIPSQEYIVELSIIRSTGSSVIERSFDALGEQLP
jgi:transcriptional regulator with XRE-family HTH domain